MNLSRLALAVTLAAAACARDGPTAPTAPLAHLVIRIDDVGERAGQPATTAITSLSVVTFDARGSNGRGLSYHIEFGDGASADAPLVAHTYSRSDYFKARLTVKDVNGYTDAIVQPVWVIPALGYWVVQDRGLGPLRFLTITSQVGRRLSGRYADGTEEDVDEQIATKPFSGELLPGRGVILTLDDGSANLEGLFPDGFDNAATRMSLVVQGGRDHGRRFTFYNYSYY